MRVEAALGAQRSVRSRPEHADMDVSSGVVELPPLAAAQPDQAATWLRRVEHRLGALGDEDATAQST